MIIEKIRIIVSSLNELIATMLKWRRNRGVTGLRPPPGGPIAARNWTSCSTILVVSFRSYQWPWSKNCRRSSMGGWAPYISRAGMFMSSMKMIAFLPMGGPKKPLRRLSILDMMMNWRQRNQPRCGPNTQLQQGQLVACLRGRHRLSPVRGIK